jgi:hypothetical protein
LRGVISYIAQYLESIGHENEFTLPTPDQVFALMRGRKQRMAASASAGSVATGASLPQEAARPSSSSSSTIRKPKSKKAVAQDDEDEEGNKEGKGKEDAGGEDSDVRYKAPLLMPDRNKSIIQCTHCGRPQVVDLKTGHACPLRQLQMG